MVNRLYQLFIIFFIITWCFGMGKLLEVETEDKVLELNNTENSQTILHIDQNLLIYRDKISCFVIELNATEEWLSKIWNNHCNKSFVTDQLQEIPKCSKYYQSESIPRHNVVNTFGSFIGKYCTGKAVHTVSRRQSTSPGYTVYLEKVEDNSTRKQKDWMFQNKQRKKRQINSYNGFQHYKSYNNYNPQSHPNERTRYNHAGLRGTHHRNYQPSYSYYQPQRNFQYYNQYDKGYQPVTSNNLRYSSRPSEEQVHVSQNFNGYNINAAQRIYGSMENSESHSGKNSLFPEVVIQNGTVFYRHDENKPSSTQNNGLHFINHTSSADQNLGLQPEINSVSFRNQDIDYGNGEDAVNNNADTSYTQENFAKGGLHYSDTVDGLKNKDYVYTQDKGQINGLEESYYQQNLNNLNYQSQNNVNIEHTENLIQPNLFNNPGQTNENNVEDSSYIDYYSDQDNYGWQGVSGKTNFVGSAKAHDQTNYIVPNEFDENVAAGFPGQVTNINGNNVVENQYSTDFQPSINTASNAVPQIKNENGNIISDSEPYYSNTGLYESSPDYANHYGHTDQFTGKNYYSNDYNDNGNSYQNGIHNSLPRPDSVAITDSFPKGDMLDSISEHVHQPDELNDDQPDYIDRGGLTGGSGVTHKEAEIEQIYTGPLPEGSEHAVTDHKENATGIVTYAHIDSGKPPGPGELLTQVRKFASAELDLNLETDRDANYDDYVYEYYDRNQSQITYKDFSNHTETISAPVQVALPEDEAAFFPRYEFNNMVEDDMNKFISDQNNIVTEIPSIVATEGIYLAPPHELVTYQPPTTTPLLNLIIMPGTRGSLKNMEPRYPGKPQIKVITIGQGDSRNYAPNRGVSLGPGDRIPGAQSYQIPPGYKARVFYGVPPPGIEQLTNSKLFTRSTQPAELTSRSSSYRQAPMKNSRMSKRPQNMRSPLKLVGAIPKKSFENDDKAVDNTIDNCNQYTEDCQQVELPFQTEICQPIYINIDCCC